MKRSWFRRSTKAAFSGGASTWHGDGEGATQAERRLTKARVLEEAYDEFCRLQEAGHVVAPSEFCQRYPTYQQSLRRLISVHRFFDEADIVEDETPLWPECGTVWLGFELLDVLGVGAMACVYRAKEKSLGDRLVAVKVSLQGDIEADMLGQLDHTNVVPVHSVQRDPESGMTAVCMPYLGSSTLADVLDEAFATGKPPDRADVILKAARRNEVDELPPAEDRLLERGSYVDGVVWLAIRMAEALQYTHGRGIIHRDLKPTNVLLSPSGRPMLLDFNLSAKTDMDTPGVGGTLPYMPPEQIREVFLPFAERHPGQMSDERSDVFALGVIMYQLLSGELPFGEPLSPFVSRSAALEYMEAQRRGPADLMKANPRVDRQLAQLIHRCLAWDPADRPASAAELVSLLAQRFRVVHRATRWCAAHRALVASCCLLVAITITGGSWAISKIPSRSERYLRQGVLQLEEGRATEAIEEFDRAEQIAGPSPQLHLARGVALMELGEYRRAVIELEDAAKSFDHPVLWEAIGYAFYRSGMVHQASGAYESAIRNGALLAKASLAKAYILAMRTKVGPAEAALSRVLDDSEFGAKAYHLRGRIRLQVGHDNVEHVQAAIADLEKAAESEPSFGFLEFDLARAYAVMAHDNPEARKKSLSHLQKAVQLGLPQSVLLATRDFALWREDPEFQRLLSEATRDDSAWPKAAKVFVAPPDHQQLIALLRR